MFYSESKTTFRKNVTDRFVTGRKIKINRSSKNSVYIQNQGSSLELVRLRRSGFHLLSQSPTERNERNHAARVLVCFFIQIRRQRRVSLEMFLLNVMFFSVHCLCLIRVLFNAQLKVIQASATQKVPYGVIKAAFHVVLFKWGNLSYSGASTVFNKHSESSSKPIIVPPSTLQFNIRFLLMEAQRRTCCREIGWNPRAASVRAQSSTRRCDFHLSITTFSVLLGSRSMEAKLTDKVKLTVNCFLPRHWRRGSVINCFVWIIY